MKPGRRYKKACFGGTFDVPLHRGHEALITKAFEVAEFCYMGLMSDFYVERKRKSGVKPFSKRKRGLVDFLSSSKIPRKRYKIIELDKFFSEEVLDPKLGIEAIVVSKETLPGARAINLIRTDTGLEPLKIVRVKTVLASDNEPISSERIRSKEIDRSGKSLKKGQRR